MKEDELKPPKYEGFIWLIAVLSTPRKIRNYDHREELDLSDKVDCVRDASAVENSLKFLVDAVARSKLNISGTFSDLSSKSWESHIEANLELEWAHWKRPRIGEVSLSLKRLLTRQEECTFQMCSRAVKAGRNLRGLGNSLSESGRGSLSHEWIPLRYKTLARFRICKFPANLRQIWLGWSRCL